MAHRNWNEHYASGELPWDTGTPDPLLVRTIRDRSIEPCRALEVGCGTGTNARWLAEQGFDVLGVDVSSVAIERASAVSVGPGAASCRFQARDFLTDEVDGGPFGFVFDRGCFHCFDEASERERFAARVAALLAPGGLWLSLIGSTEGPPRDYGPPRRSARDIVTAMEPALAVVELSSAHFDLDRDHPPQAWMCLTRAREIPAQPSSRHP